MPVRPGAGGAPDAVHVALVVLGRIEVDHVRDAGHVDAAGGDIGRHQRVHGSGLKAAQGRFALALGLVAVHGHRVDAVCGEALDQAVGAALGADEHERAVTLVLELGEQGLEPLAAVHGDEAMLDVDGGAARRRPVLVVDGV